MFYDMHIGFAVRARRLENAAGRSNIKKTQQRRIDPDLRVPSIVTKANIPLENILIDKNDKENGVSLWLIARKYPAHLRNKRFHANLFPSFSFLIRPEVVERIETQTWNSTGKKKNFTNAEEKRWNLHKDSVDPELSKRIPTPLGLFVARITSITRCIGERLSISIERHRFLRQITTIGVSISNLYY